MSGLLAPVVSQPGLAWIVAAALVAGIVRGFSGFGTAMVYLPVASHFLSPFEALTTVVMMDLLGPLPIVPRALRDAHRRDVLRLGAGLAVGLPFGVWVLAQVSPDAFRYAVSIVALILLSLLVSGVRYRGRLATPLIYGVGGLGGVLGGITGLAGPPVIMLYMASENPARTIRANLILYLLLTDVVTIAVFGVADFLTVQGVVLGLVVMVPFLAGNLIGARLFRPEGERIYRMAAYAIIAVSALQGLPVFD